MTIRARLTGVAAAFLGCALAATAAPAGAVAGFGDVEEDRYYTEAVQWMVDNEITEGVTPACFAPDDRVTRGQLAAFLYRMEGEPAGAPAHGFRDVVEPWQHDAVSWMAHEGITQGTGPVTYSPSDGLSRGEFAAFVHRLADEPPAESHDFVDVVAPWQHDAVAWMVSAGVTTGTSPTTYSPDDPVTRAQLAAFLYRYQGRPSVATDGSSPYCELSNTPRQLTRTGWSPFATSGPVTLVHPAAEVELIAYHESGHDGSQQLHTTASAATTLTMETRYRGTGSRTAADIAVSPAAEIRSPVTGTVLRSGGYVLYCDTRDEFVVVEPDSRPGWEVKMFHVTGVQVEPGDRLVAGVTVIAERPTQLPFVSQIDEHTTEPSWPHVHIEVVDPSIPDRPGGGC